MIIKSPIVYIVMPVFDEDEDIVSGVVSDLQQQGYTKIILIDDGSTRHTYENIDRSVILVRHMINRGKGAAMRTGLAAAKQLGAERVVTMDGDGQHDARDIATMLHVMDEGSDVVLGTRDFTSRSIPMIKRFFNYVGNGMTFIMCGLMVHDSQSGFRVYSQRALECMDLKSNRYEYESEVIYEIYKNKLTFKEIPINVRYTRYSQEKMQKQSFMNGIKTSLKMIFFK